MANSFDLLIQELKALMKKISDDGSNTQATGLLYLLKTATLTTDSNNNAVSKELKDIIAAFTSQNTYTDSTLAFLNSLHPPTATLETLKTATNLIQIYFQVTQPLEQILSDLIDNLPPAAEVKGGVTSAKIQASIKTIKIDRQDLQKVQDKALQEFGSVLEELDLQKLVQTSSVILIELKNSPNLDVLSTAIDRLISHLTSAQEFFQTFGENDGNITGNEPNEIQQLIKNWGESVAQVETIEKINPTIQSALGIPSNSRLAIAQSIKIHDLLETNYDYLTALVRSIDLVSAGSL
jgi:hypothetical protein